ncbi:phosphatidylinositol N-acetylglucosaminyltransferase subunit P [Achroia grisella]|uniref:phosphatidylinositol N-acetylglucosaminyltransferase subunit P n=1 Tax=Achroia grisella TaxID=688607 RepID=UPI0027D254C2|nr:phosphatidylinositol N-acetylglucosaminyltransferase subunit P [Achroia grisella]XP_059054230.1 phosphatidylinositol N-acetylglucosaminyltransferase subunit P [Achroia grisella]
MPEQTPAPTPARSLYGFFMYVFSNTMLVIYLIWAFIPDHYLHYLNIYYYPVKYWSIAVPIQCLVALTLFVFLIYPSLTMILTLNIDSQNTIRDPFSHYSNKTIKNNYKIDNFCTCVDEKKCLKSNYTSIPKDYNENTVPELHDLNISYVCKKIYVIKEDNFKD